MLNDGLEAEAEARSQEIEVKVKCKKNSQLCMSAVIITVMIII